MRHAKKHLSLFLALLMTLSLVPASILGAAAADAYQVLFEPQLQGPVGIAYDVNMGAYGDTAAVYSVTDKVYNFVRFTGSGLESFAGGYYDLPEIGAEYIAVDNADYMSGVINKKGEKVIDFTYGNISRPDDSGRARAWQGDNYYLLDLSSKKAEPVSYDAYYQFGWEGYTTQETDDTVQILDPSGAVVLSDAGKNYSINPYSLTSIKEGMVEVWARDTYGSGFVNLKGEMVIPAQYEWVKPFRNGYAVVYNENNSAALFDAKGNIVIPFGQYGCISDVSKDGLVWASNSDGTKVSILRVGGGSTTPVTPVTPETADAMPTNDTLMVNGVVQNPTVYKIDGSNYFKIRDLAAVLNGTSKQFEVGYDGATSSVTATTGQAYTVTNTELAGAASSNQTATASNDTILVNGVKAENVTVYKIDGSNYFKLRDLGAVLGFDVGWDAENNIASINTEG